MNLMQIISAGPKHALYSNVYACVTDNCKCHTLNTAGQTQRHILRRSGVLKALVLVGSVTLCCPELQRTLETLKTASLTSLQNLCRLERSLKAMLRRHSRWQSFTYIHGR